MIEIKGIQHCFKINKAIEINQFGDGPIYYSGNAVLFDINKRGEGEVEHI